MIGQHLTEYAGLPVVEFLSQEAEQQHLREATWRAHRDEREAPTSTPHRERMEKAMTAPGSVAWRLHLVEGDEDFPGYMAQFVREVDTSLVTALVIGNWGLWDGPDIPSTEVRDVLIEHAASFPALRALFFGDITFEESEISWIQQCDLAPLLISLPRLEEFTVRGVGETFHPDSSILSLEVPEHTGLR